MKHTQYQVMVTIDVLAHHDAVHDAITKQSQDALASLINNGTYPAGVNISQIHFGKSIDVPHTGIKADDQLDAVYTKLALQSEDGVLDDLVHDVASQTGSAVNNGGLDAQWEFLLESLGREDLIKEVTSLLKDHDV